MSLYSPLRYPGSKRKLSNYLGRVLSHNRLKTGVLVEPFVGGGNIFINFLYQNKKGRAIIADKDGLIYSFWKVLFSEPEYLISFVRRTRVNLKTFDYYRYISSHSAKFSKKKLAEACLFLNRTSYSGILNDSAGPIGGREQKSAFKIDCRFGKENLIKKIKTISAFKDRVKVLPYSWERTLRFIDKNEKGKKSNLLYYFDPPFFKKADRLYRHHFSETSHKKLRDRLVKLKRPWILSYDRAQEIRNLYSSFSRIHVSMPYSINSPAKRLEKELIITPLKLPRINLEAEY